MLLTDSRNCGACGRDCLGGACSGGVCQPVILATGLSPARIAIDAQFVYWTNEGTSANNYTDGFISRVPKNGGAPVTLLNNLPRPMGIAVDATDLVFTTLGPSNVPYNYQGGTVRRLPLSGGTATFIATSQAAPWSVALNAGTVYWTCGGTYTQSGGVSYYQHDGAVKKAAKDGSGFTVLASSLEEPVALAFPGWVTNNGPTVVWALRGGFLSSAGGVMEYTPGLTPRMLATGQPWPMSIAADTDYAYYPVHGGGVRKVLLSGSASPFVIRDTLGGNSAQGIVIDATSVYWPESGGGVLRKAPRGGGVTTDLHTITNNTTGPRGLAADAQALYWVAEFSGSILRLAK
ncbi:hypothetical protein [Bosea sp. (in: a-proteobacteria)]|uniref:hypothetical protein n=1 Tax=Bosea sp. (in: a-proteobacteria) TaxID=1871050 RepID=UPI002732F8BB|nr:hypothetical protein [Bosea sp. (in: a-proteobacteria)]MDP3410121.1 hypothetical protein [Bosea sp. (in: a-proteobacteria)]